MALRGELEIICPVLFPPLRQETFRDEQRRYFAVEAISLRVFSVRL